jgi:hypothetical protein
MEMTGIVNTVRDGWKRERPFSSKTNRDGLYFMALGCVVFILLGWALENSGSLSPIDFRTPYYGARCLLRNGDPYNENDVLRIYEADGGARDLESGFRSIPFMYMPSFFSVILPFAVLPFGLAQAIWNVLIYGGLIVVSFLIWFVALKSAPTMSGCLIGFMLANSECLAMVGNPAGVAISLTIVAVLCFLNERFAALGVACLALALVIKPHDIGFVWLYFLLVSGTYRKRALQSLVVVLIVSAPTFLWVNHASPHWLEELSTTLKLSAIHGGPNDPGPTSSGAHGLGMMVNLQTALSFFRDDPHFYTPVTYGVCGGLLGVWAYVVLRSRPTPGRAWLALASVSALTMLPIYHRQYDTKLLLLTVPACAMLWAEGGRTGKLALLITGAAFLVNGDILWVSFFLMLRLFHIPPTDLNRQLVAAAQMIPAPLTLLLAGAFYLFIFARRSHEVQLRDIPLAT